MKPVEVRVISCRRADGAVTVHQKTPEDASVYFPDRLAFEKHLVVHMPLETKLDGLDARHALADPWAICFSSWATARCWPLGAAR